MPKPGDEYYSNKPIQLSSQGSSDPDDEVLTFTWYSNLEGEIYTTSNYVAEVFLSEGFHTITLTVTDALGAFNSISIQITVVELYNEVSPLLSQVGILFTVIIISMIAMFNRKKL